MVKCKLHQRFLTVETVALVVVDVVLAMHNALVTLVQQTLAEVEAVVIDLLLQTEVVLEVAVLLSYAIKMTKPLLLAQV
jgi:hypothetical protein